jgi:hypothetical protein
LENSLGDHLVGRWTFDETADLCGTNKVCDTSGWNNNGTMNNFVSPYGLVLETLSGQGQAMSFDGVDDYVDIDNNASLILTKFSIEAWINRQEGTTAQAVVYKGTSCGADCNFGLYIENDRTPRISFNTGGSGVDSWLSSGAGSYTIENNRWYHLFGTYDLQNLKLYVDGNLYKSVATSSIPDQSTGHLKIGTHCDNEIRWFDGLIDEVSIYSTAFSANQVKFQYCAGLNKLLAKKQITEQEYQQKLARQ